MKVGHYPRFISCLVQAIVLLGPDNVVDIIAIFLLKYISMCEFLNDPFPKHAFYENKMKDLILRVSP